LRAFSFVHLQLASKADSKAALRTWPRTYAYRWPRLTSAIPPLSACCYRTGDLALCPVSSELSRCRRFIGRTRRDGLIRNCSALGEPFWAEDRSGPAQTPTQTTHDLASRRSLSEYLEKEFARGVYHEKVALVPGLFPGLTGGLFLEDLLGDAREATCPARLRHESRGQAFPKTGQTDQRRATTSETGRSRRRRGGGVSIRQ
jgi:hypothetical protein